MAEHKHTIVYERDIQCRICGSKDVSKFGIRNGIQYFICKSCGKKFSSVDAYPDMRYDKELIIRAITNYYNGMSFRNITQTFNDLYDLDMPKSTV